MDEADEVGGRPVRRRQRGRDAAIEGRSDSRLSLSPQSRLEVIRDQVITCRGFPNLLWVVVRDLDHAEEDFKRFWQVLSEEAARVRFPSHLYVLVLHQLTEGPDYRHNESVREIILAFATGLAGYPLMERRRTLSSIAR